MSDVPEFGDVIVGRGREAVFCLGDDGTGFLSVHYIRIKYLSSEDLRSRPLDTNAMILGGGSCSPEVWSSYARHGGGWS